LVPSLFFPPPPPPTLMFHLHLWKHHSYDVISCLLEMGFLSNGHSLYVTDFSHNALNYSLNIIILFASSEAFMAVMFQVEVCRVVTPCSVVGYQRFRGPWFWRWRQHGSLKRWYPTTALHDVIAQETSTCYSFMPSLGWSSHNSLPPTILSYNFYGHNNSNKHVYQRHTHIYSERSLHLTKKLVSVKHL
jgi:hypothetical protein